MLFISLTKNYYSKGNKREIIKQNYSFSYTLQNKHLYFLKA